MSPSPTLGGLPLHILQQITSYTDEPTVWATMATSRAMREAGEKALKPFLVEKVVNAQPSFLINNTSLHRVLSGADTSEFESIPPMDDEDEIEDRHDSLRDRLAAFTRHLAAYPKSNSALRRLTIEAFAQTSGEEVSGWSQLRDLLPQLEQLEVHVFEPLRIDPMDEETDEDSCSSQYMRREEDCHDVGEIWFDLSNDWDDATEKRFFPNLTHLSIHTTNRVLEHLNAVCHYLPNLRHLTLGAHWAVSDLLGNRHEVEDLVNIPKSSNLETLTIIGGEQTHIDGLAVLLQAPHAIRQVTLCILDLPEPRSGGGMPEFTNDTTIPMSERHRVEHLALYGSSAFDFFISVLYQQSGISFDATFRHITVLVLERVREEGREGLGYPILDGLESGERIPLPSIQRISYIDLHTDENGAYTLGTLSPSDQSEFFTPNAPKLLFSRYKTLRQVYFTAGCPTDAFAEHPHSDWAEQNIRCCLYLEGKSVMFRRPRVPAAGQTKSG